MGNAPATHPVGRTNVRAWALGWVGAAALGVANGVARRVGYEQRLGELRAHQVSTATATGLLAAYTFLLDRRWPITSAGDAAAVGGHYVAHMPWPELIRDYDLRHGHLWSLVLVTLAASPGVAYLARTRGAASRVPA